MYSFVIDSSLTFFSPLSDVYKPRVSACSILYFLLFMMNIDINLTTYLVWIGSSAGWTHWQSDVGASTQ
jgi:hypothetical protein